MFVYAAINWGFVEPAWGESMLDHVKNRVTLYRRYKRLASILNALVENQVIDEQEFRRFRKRLDDMNEKAKVRIKSEKEPLPRGRPRLPDQRPKFAICRKVGCDRRAAPGQVFCSREHSPYGNYGLNKGWITKDE